MEKTREKKRRESRYTSAEESGPCQQLPPSRKKKWQLPWLDGAYETIIPPPYLVLYVWTSSVRARRAGRVATLGRGGKRRGRKEEGTRTRERERKREEWEETESVEKSDVGRGETTWVSSDDYDDDYDDDEDDDEDDGGDDHHRLTERLLLWTLVHVCMYRRLPVGSFGLTWARGKEKERAERREEERHGNNV